MPTRKEDSALSGRDGRSDERHTAGPWRKSGTLVCDQHGNKVADCFTNQLDGLCDEGNAAFIVRACNAHNDLLEALKEARSWIVRSGAAHPSVPLTYIDAAIKKAEA